MPQYTVKSGDSLSLISKKLSGSVGNWKTLYNLNLNVIGKDPNKIRPGQILTLPSSWSGGSAPISTQIINPPINTIATPPFVPNTPINQNSAAIEQGSPIVEEKKSLVLPLILAGAAAWYFLG
jgi:LysM repeat protein